MKLKEFDVIIERDKEGWYIADVPALKGCHTQARTKKELIKNVREAIGLCIEVQAEYKAKDKTPFVEVQKIAVYA